MTEEKSSGQHNRLISLICSLPYWWLGVKGYKSAMLPSKYPDFIGLYSWEKVIGLVGIFLICAIGIKFLHPKLCSWMESFHTKLNLSLPSPYLSFLCLFVLGSLFTVSKGTVVGEDISVQVLSTQQFISGKINAPNKVLGPSIGDLSTNTQGWHVRPPGASWFALPGMFLGLPLGLAIKFSLIFVGLLGGIGWLKLSVKLGIKRQGFFYLAILLALSIGLTINRLGTMNSTLFAIVPWMLLWAIQISAKKFHNKRAFSKSTILIAIFYLFLGCFCLLKMSGLIVALTIGFVPVLLVYLKKTALRKNLLLLTLVILAPSILLPANVLRKINLDNLGYDSHDLYSNQDYNQQSSLWGEYFVESTKGKMLLLSALGSPGYASPVKSLMHSAKDFCLHLKSFTNWCTANKVNVHAFVCGIFGIITLILIVLSIRKNKSLYPKLSLRIFSTFYFIPFLGLATLSYLHGFNYSLYATHTIEYSLLMLFPIIILWERSELNRLVYKSFVSILLALPMLNIINLLTVNIDEGFISSTEKERGLSSSQFSEAIDYIENDSINELDIIYFLPQGNMSDLVLRSKMRTMATHFSGDNFPKTQPYRTSKKLNIYLAYNEKLSEIPEFLKATSEKFPNSISGKTILKGRITVKKIELNPCPSVT